jgi:hypothetical protein
MKYIKSILSYVLALIALALIVSAANAATWNKATGNGDDGYGYFSAAGIPLTVIGSVRSNTVYTVVGSRAALGAPLVDSIWVKTDLAAAALEFWVPTNTWTCASNQPAGTNQIWLTTTNAGLATNDLLVLEHQDGTAQLLVLGGGTTDAAGLVGSNSLAQTLVKFWTTPTNAITAGDKLHKLALRSSFEPLKMHAITNTVGTPFGNWLAMAHQNVPLKLYGNIGLPVVVSLSYSNAASLKTDGVLKRREQ